MMDRMPRIEAGELFILTSGEYSDYGVVGLFRALADIDLGPLMDEYAKAIAEAVAAHDTKHRPGEDGLIRWLTTDKKVAEELPYSEARMGNSWDWEEGQHGGIWVTRYLAPEP